MKRLISFTVALAMVMSMLTSFAVVSHAATANMLTDGGFETSTLSDANSWKFTGGSNWYSYGNGAITTEQKAEGEKSIVFSSGVIGQRVSLEAGKKYTLTAQIYTTAQTTVKMGFHDGTKSYPNDNPVLREDKTLSKANEWDTVTLNFECDKSQDYVIIFYNDKKTEMYIDDITLTVSHPRENRQKNRTKTE